MHIFCSRVHGTMADQKLQGFAAKKKLLLPQSRAIACISSGMHLFSLLVLALTLIRILLVLALVHLAAIFLLESIYWSETSEVYQINRNKAVPSLIWDFFLCYFLSLKGFAVSYCLLRCSLKMLSNRCQESVKHKIVWIKIYSN